jgi:glycosyltransferase involved in cell wall biosynthesis
MDDKGMAKILLLASALPSCTVIVANAHAGGSGAGSGFQAVQDLRGAGERLGFWVAPRGQRRDFEEDTLTVDRPRLLITSEIFPETSEVGLQAAEIRALMSLTTCFAMLSRQESCGLTALEAAACRVPVILVNKYLGNTVEALKGVPGVILTDFYRYDTDEHDEMLEHIRELLRNSDRCSALVDLEDLGERLEALC